MAIYSIINVVYFLELDNHSFFIFKKINHIMLANVPKKKHEICTRPTHQFKKNANKKTERETILQKTQF